MKNVITKANPQTGDAAPEDKSEEDLVSFIFLDEFDVNKENEYHHKKESNGHLGKLDILNKKRTMSNTILNIPKQNNKKSIDIKITKIDSKPFENPHTTEPTIENASENKSANFENVSEDLSPNIEDVSKTYHQI